MNNEKETLLDRFMAAVRDSRKKWTDQFRSGKQIVEDLHRWDATWDRPAAKMIKDVEMRTDYSMPGWQERARDYYQRDRERRWRNRPDATEGDRWGPIRTPVDHLDPRPRNEAEAQHDAALTREIKDIQFQGRTAEQMQWEKTVAKAAQIDNAALGVEHERGTRVETLTPPRASIWADNKDRTAEIARTVAAAENTHDHTNGRER